MRKILLSILVIGYFFGSPIVHAAQNKIINVSSPNNVVKQYELFEANIILDNNQLKTDDAIMDAEISIPNKRAVTIPAFYSGKESAWKIRYSPSKTGTYSYKLKLKTPERTYYSKVMYFKVIPNRSDGFIRKAGYNPFYPVFDSGKPFFGIGHNIGWVTNNSPAGYERYFALLKDNGCNITRIWTNSPWTFKIETEKTGVYNIEDSEKLDKVLEHAKKYGIYIILVLDTYGTLMEERGDWNEQCWKTNFYNKINGGPCEKPWDFFTNETAKQLYKNRLRYMVARWSYSPNIMAFELWNELDAPVEWTKEMAQYLRSINPHGQFITTSLGYPWGNIFDESSIWRLDEIDMIDKHIYGNTTGDVTENIISATRELSNRYNKYVVVGEFGIDAGKSDAQVDSSGDAAALHNSLWASIVSRTFSTSLNWWWAEYIKAKNLYPHYKAFSAFVQNVKWDSKHIDFLKISSVKCKQGARACTFSNVTISANDAWGELTYREFTINNNGNLSGGILNAYLHGSCKEEMKIEPVFNVDYPVNGRFTIHIDTVSQGAKLIITMDGKEALTKELPAGTGKGPWKRSLYRKDIDIYQCVYDADISLDVPAGKHVIKLSNTGLDWIRIKNITLENYSSSLFVKAAASGMRVGEEMLFWIYNKEYNWRNLKKEIEPSLIKGASFIVENVENGNYNIDWWDTLEGKIILRRKSASKNKELLIEVPDFSKDLACKINKI